MLPTVISKNTMGLFGLGLSDMGAAMLVRDGLEAGSSDVVVPSREYRRMRAQFEASLKACFHFDSYKF